MSATKRVADWLIPLYLLCFCAIFMVYTNPSARRADTKYASGAFLMGLVVQAESGGRSMFPRLFLASLLLAALAQSQGLLLLGYLTHPSLGSLPTGSYTALRFYLPSFLGFLINPVLLSAVLYLLGRGVDLAPNYVRVGVSLFLGGVVGNSVPYFLLPELLGSQWVGVFPDLLSVVTTTVVFAMIVIGFGLSTLFPGFVAITVANLRARGRTSTVESQGESSDEKTESRQSP